MPSNSCQQKHEIMIRAMTGMNLWLQSQFWQQKTNEVLVVARITLSADKKIQALPFPRTSVALIHNFVQNNCVMIFGSLGVPAISCHTPKFKIPLPTTRLQDFKWSHWPKFVLLKVTDSKDFPPQTPARLIPATAPVPEKSYKSPPYFRPLIP